VGTIGIPDPGIGNALRRIDAEVNCRMDREWKIYGESAVGSAVIVSYF